MKLVYVAAVLLVSCGSSEPPPPAPDPAQGTHDDPQPGGDTTRPGPGVVEEAPRPIPEPSPAQAAGCSADASHCCLPDGRVVVPGGCQPVHRAGQHPNVTRGDDGRCVQIECLLRCLPATARIATPTGTVEIAELRVGDLIFTIDDGRRVARPVVRIASVPRTAPHTILEMTLSDGRITRGSARHPTSDDRELGGLSVGDRLDGASITAIEVIPYAGAATWDVLPAGDTGTYFAEGVWLGSTLRTRDP